MDHVYVTNFVMVENIDFKVPTFGDHYLIVADLNEINGKAKSIFKRNLFCVIKETFISTRHRTRYQAQCIGPFR